MRFATQRLYKELSSFFKVIGLEIHCVTKRSFLSQSGQIRTRFKPFYFLNFYLKEISPKCAIHLKFEIKALY